ncbi:ribonuclease [Brevundimonas subvibrioides]|uniref:ribonuclease n=1 Tax=Brevundimonas subvibrioides TaxID=74313 RepID=UPI0022B370E2|nr:ribonuclease [Brevundimonas subvibrioides]
MTDKTPTTREAIEAEASGEHPDLGRTPDALIEALSGSGMGSDTRAGSLEGGAASGSDDDPDQASVDRTMAEEGRAGSKRDDETDPVRG